MAYIPKTPRKQGKGKCSRCGRRIRENNIFTTSGPTKKWKEWLADNDTARNNGTAALLCWACWNNSKAEAEERRAHAHCSPHACCRVWDEQENCGMGGWRCIHKQAECPYNDTYNVCTHDGSDPHPIDRNAVTPR